MITDIVEMRKVKAQKKIKINSRGEIKKSDSSIEHKN